MAFFIAFCFGIAFGVFLQLGGVLDYEKQVNAMLFKDMAIFKFMLSAICIAMIGLYVLRDFELIEFHVKATYVGAFIIGGLIFGIGWGLLGYCPGTSFGACGQGKIDAFIGIIGGLFGSVIYAFAYPWVKNNIYEWGNYGKITFLDIIPINQWLFIALFITLILLFFYFIEKKNI